MVRRYEQSDFDEVNSWAKQWGSTYEPDLLPPTGFIVPGIACYFLYTTDSRVCFMENLISNKEVNYTIRNEAIQAITETMLLYATERNLRIAYACTNNPAVITRAMTYGVNVTLGYVLLQKELNKS